ncbi:MAG: hypothetical protein H0X29_09665 [Parachlamydiaceae bacterium]|nr:hypothetical protein [Parachlamydiaceae bacterium]
MTLPVNSESTMAHYEVCENKFPSTKDIFVYGENERFEPHEVIFKNKNRGSLFSDVLINFKEKSITVAAEDTKLREKFYSYFINQGFNKDSVSLCYYKARTNLELHRLSKILLANNEFPKDWQLFFLTLQKEGTWTINSKKALSSL